MHSVLTSAAKGSRGNEVLMAGFLGLILSDIIPTPGDALYFYDQQRLSRKRASGELSVRQFWIKNALGYYLYNSGWWALVFAVTMLAGGNVNQKIKVALILAGGGAVIGTLAKNIKKDYHGTAVK